MDINDTIVKTPDELGVGKVSHGTCESDLDQDKNGEEDSEEITNDDVVDIVAEQSLVKNIENVSTQTQAVGRQDTQDVMGKTSANSGVAGTFATKNFQELKMKELLFQQMDL